MTTKHPAVNLPNALTVFRMVLVPVFIGFYIWGDPVARWIALGIFVIAGFTDQLDGHIARSRNLVTDFGRLADPLADKALTLSAFIVLSIDGIIPYFWIFTALVAIREVGITVLREVLRRQGTVVSASSGGKLKTVLQMLLIFLMLIPWQTFVSASAVTAIMWVLIVLAIVTLGVTLVSGWQYCAAAWRDSHQKSS